MTLSIRCVRDNAFLVIRTLQHGLKHGQCSNVERESAGDCKFSSTHSQDDMMGKTGNIHNIFTKGFIFMI